eukprot:503578_1
MRPHHVDTNVYCPRDVRNEFLDECLDDLDTNFVKKSKSVLQWNWSWVQFKHFVTAMEMDPLPAIEDDSYSYYLEQIRCKITGTKFKAKAVSLRRNKMSGFIEGESLLDFWCGFGDLNHVHLAYMLLFCDRKMVNHMSSLNKGWRIACKKVNHEVLRIGFGAIFS